MLCSTVFKFPFFSSLSFFHCPAPFFFLFFFFFNNKLLIHCPFFSNLISASLCLYLNTITIGSLPRLFNFNPHFHKISQVYNKTFSIAYVYPSFFFALKYPRCSFQKQPKRLSIWPTTFPNSKQFQILVCESPNIQ